MMCCAFYLTAQNSSKIPFQGNLTENGTPVDGERSFVFSIDDISWTETHDAITITKGFYAVVLGSITPLPETLFDDVESRSLTISVAGESLGSLTIYAPFTTAALNADSLVVESVTASNSIRVSNRLLYDTSSGDLKLFNEDGAEKVDLNVFEDNDAGSLVMYGNDDLRTVILGSSGARNGNTGFLGLYDELGNQKASLRVDELDGSITGGVLSIRSNAPRSTGGFAETIKLSNVNDAGVLALRDVESTQNITLYGENGNADFAGDVTISGNLQVTGASDISLPDSIGKLNEIDTGTVVGFTSTLEGVGAVVNRGLYGLAKTEGYNVGVQGTSNSTSSNTQRNTGVYGLASGDGDGDHRGVLGYAVGAGKYNKGLYGIAEGAGNGDTGQGFGEGSINFGVEGNAGGNAWNNTGLEGSNFGTEGVWNFGVHGISSAGSVETAENHGVAGRAYGPGINYGVYGEANSGAENWAGFFNGDVKVTGNLTVDGGSIVGLPDSVGKTTDVTTGTVIGFTSTIDGDGADVNRGLYGYANTNRYNVGVQGSSNSASTNTERNTGVYGLASGDGTGDHRGVLGYAVGAGKYNKGLYGIAEGAGNGDTGKGYGEGSINFGIEGNAGGNAWNNTGLEGSNFGTEGVWNFGVHGISSAGTATTAENHGVAGRAYGPGINYGVFGEANSGVENWAGYFIGDVQTIGTLNVDGNIVATGDISGTTITPSDRRLKTNIKPINGAMKLVKSLNGVTFNWNENAPGTRNGISDVGVIAQEVEAVLPELVKETPDGYKAVNYAQLTAVLIEAVKEMDQKIKHLEKENASLQAQLGEEMEKLRNQLDSFQSLMKKEQKVSVGSTSK